MDQIGVFTPEQARLLWQDFQTRQQLGPQLRYNFPQRRPIEDVSPHRVLIKNTENEVIPPFACVRVTGVSDIGGRTCLLVEKPSSTAGEFLFNSQYEIPVAVTADPEAEVDGVTGVGWAYRFGHVTMLGDAPTYAGAMYGPVVDSWEVDEGGGAFVVYGRQDISSRTLLGQIATRKLMVILDADLPAASHALTGPTSCLATICKWTSSDEEAAERTSQITVWNHSENANHVADTYGEAEWHEGHWHFHGDCHAMNART